MENLIYILPGFGILGLLYMLYLRSWVKKQPAGDAKMKKLSGYIATGALAFLKAEYKMLAIFVIVAGAILGVLSGMGIIPASLYIVAAFVVGAVFSAFAGNIGMRMATKANVRTAEAAKTSLPQAMKVAFRGGTVMGLGVAGLAVFGLSSIFMFLFLQSDNPNDPHTMTVLLETLAGFSLGAECIALFARVGGGIYTKAADVGADLVGKVEVGIPEDDIRNPATIADNV
ncbi:MAG: sodium/proton-translocating pyrophosphatase, partial [Flavobacteriales bacterium]|nr:sodium/proton-translocating pyrophosphatase [Flavobacteriales bacterium]